MREAGQAAAAPQVQPAGRGPAGQVGCAVRALALATGLATGLVLGGCATAPPPSALPADLLQDAHFAAPPAAIDVEADPFALSEPMRRYLATELAKPLRGRTRQQALVDALLRRGDLKLDYDAAVTRSAAEAFDARSGNCLSLVLMTGAFAKALGLQVGYQRALIDEGWSRSGTLALRSGHVNLRLGRRPLDAGRSVGDEALTIDFLPPAELRGLRTAPVSEGDVLAMFRNNRAAEALTRGELDAAYAWARAAVRGHPAATGALNTLGVVYLQRDLPQAALQVFAHVLAREPAHLSALANQARALERLGRTAEAAQARDRLARLEAAPPFHGLALGLAALRRGEAHEARRWLSLEMARSGPSSELHHALGVAAYRLGDEAEAARQLALARDRGGPPGETTRYAAKLAWLQTQAQDPLAPPR